MGLDQFKCESKLGKCLSIGYRDTGQSPIFTVYLGAWTPVTSYRNGGADIREFFPLFSHIILRNYAWQNIGCFGEVSRLLVFGRLKTSPAPHWHITTDLTRASAKFDTRQFANLKYPEDTIWPLRNKREIRPDFQWPMLFGRKWSRKTDKVNIFIFSVQETESGEDPPGFHIGRVLKRSPTNSPQFIEW
jgi:hypothetical protein